MTQDPVLLYESSDSGMTGSWSWRIWLDRNANGTYRLSLDCDVWDDFAEDGGSEDEPTSYELESFTSGQELFEFVDTAWSSEHGEGLDEDAWSEVLDALELAAPELVAELTELALPDRMTPNQTTAAAVLDAWVEAAHWDEPELRDLASRWSAWGEIRQMNAQLESYARAYQRKHGHLPTGEHEVAGQRVVFPDSLQPLPQTAKE